MIYILTVFCFFVVFTIFFRIEVTGRENIPRKGGFIFASNHTSHLDPPILAVASCRRRLNFLAKKELFSNRFFAAYIRTLNAFPIKRDTVDTGALKECLRRLRRGQGLVVFPAGTRSQSLSDSQGLPGIGFLAIKSNAFVVPAYISGSNAALSKGSKRIRIKKLYVRIGKPMRFTADKKNVDYAEISRSIIASIQQLSCDK